MTGTQSNRRYGAEASILLIGMRGTGLSTLAFMAARALKFRVVDSEQVFHQVTGLSRHSYSSKYGATEYRRRELELLQSMLSQNSQSCIIVCSLGAIQGTGQEYIAQYSKGHPVIHVMRDAKSVQKYLKSRDIETVTELIRRTDPIYRRLSSFEFYNVNDASSDHCELNGKTNEQVPGTLTLKQLEADFVQLVERISFHQTYPHDAREHSFPVSPEVRQYTYALPVLLSDWSEGFSRVGNADILADALQLIVADYRTVRHEQGLDDLTATRISQQYFQAKRQSHLPVMFHAARYTSTDFHVRSMIGPPVPDHAYMRLLNHGLRLCPEYLCIDLSIDEAEILRLVASKGSTKIIGDIHIEEPGVDGWNQPGRKELVEKAQRLGCDLIRMSQDAQNMDDNFAVRSFAYKIKTDVGIHVPLIAYNTGRLGRTSQFLNPIFSPVMNPVFSPSSHPGPTREQLLTVRESQAALYSSLVLEGLKYGIYGSNVTHSFSPQMHNAAFDFCGMPHEYSIFQHATLGPLREILQREDLGGVSISAPFKQDVRQYVDSMSFEAQAIGAINTILPLRSKSTNPTTLRNRTGKVTGLHGDNTDWTGIYECVQRNLSPINAIKPGTTALVLGAGGMARAAIFALIRLGVRTIFIHNRTESNAVRLVKHFQGKSFSKDQDPNCYHSVSKHDEAAVIRVLHSRDEPWPTNVAAPTIIVSCITVQEAEDKPPVNFTLQDSWLESTTAGVAIELAYTPIETPFLQQIRSLADQGWIACDGLQVLPEQGVKQFELFTGRKAPQKLMRHIVYRVLHEAEAKTSDRPPA
ncbi:hypothetical protein M409DRAFT_37636 [Zasmidium cellare ATCC 36951]|uniref:Uncharacterized protein n=1 Tax=Zasmidium cellare ATCC 36951 TaxID=1080233 RepID=A0A6A6C2A2_ZASCE|nr:uncharacterized protein M409DRAFT_37636 [Zasmidium cellare ATCC 36951]KAF2161043.1 hypothetical protein M409DRAFT_37636 [Zasmidium cellare ATCC 36951]